MPWFMFAAVYVEHIKQFERLDSKATTSHVKSPKPFPASEALMKIAPMNHQLGGDAAKNRIVAG